MAQKSKNETLKEINQDSKLNKTSKRRNQGYTLEKSIQKALSESKQGLGQRHEEIWNILKLY